MIRRLFESLAGYLHRLFFEVDDKRKAALMALGTVNHTGDNISETSARFVIKTQTWKRFISATFDFAAKSLLNRFQFDSGTYFSYFRSVIPTEK